MGGRSPSGEQFNCDEVDMACSDTVIDPLRSVVCPQPHDTHQSAVQVQDHDGDRPPPPLSQCYSPPSTRWLTASTEMVQGCEAVMNFIPSAESSGERGSLLEFSAGFRDPRCSVASVLGEGRSDRVAPPSSERGLLRKCMRVWWVGPT